MRKLKRKEWLDRRCRKLQRRGKKRKTYIASRSKSTKKGKKKLFQDYGDVVTKKTPDCFSFVKNEHQTAEFFEDIVSEIKKKERRKGFYIDSRDVYFVSVETLIYLIAIMQNIKLNQIMRYSFAGNLPNDPEMSTVFRESGFMNYVQSKVKRLPPNTNKMMITSGRKTDSKTSGQICDFVIEKLNKTRIETKDLQAILIELMSNVFHHAYSGNEIMHELWYIYAEYDQDRVRIVFVDTGAGIARTVNRKWNEKTKRLFGGKILESELLKSTMAGDFRTETKEKHRGNGLIGIRDKIINGSFDNFILISGKAHCKINGESLEYLELNSGIYGTMVIFDVI